MDICTFVSRDLEQFLGRCVPTRAAMVWTINSRVLYKHARFTVSACSEVVDRLFKDKTSDQSFYERVEAEVSVKQADDNEGSATRVWAPEEFLRRGVPLQAEVLARYISSDGAVTCRMVVLPVTFGAWFGSSCTFCPYNYFFLGRHKTLLHSYKVRPVQKKVRLANKGDDYRLVNELASFVPYPLKEEDGSRSWRVRGLSQWECELAHEAERCLLDTYRRFGLLDGEVPFWAKTLLESPACMASSMIRNHFEQAREHTVVVEGDGVTLQQLKVRSSSITHQRLTNLSIEENEDSRFGLVLLFSELVPNQLAKSIVRKVLHPSMTIVDDADGEEPAAVRNPNDQHLDLTKRLVSKSVRSGTYSGRSFQGGSEMRCYEPVLPTTSGGFDKLQMPSMNVSINRTPGEDGPEEKYSFDPSFVGRVSLDWIPDDDNAGKSLRFAASARISQPVNRGLWYWERFVARCERDELASRFYFADDDKLLVRKGSVARTDWFPGDVHCDDSCTTLTRASVSERGLWVVPPEWPVKQVLVVHWPRSIADVKKALEDAKRERGERAMPVHCQMLAHPGGPFSLECASVDGMARFLPVPGDADKAEEGAGVLVVDDGERSVERSTWASVTGLYAASMDLFVRGLLPPDVATIPFDHGILLRYTSTDPSCFRRLLRQAGTRALDALEEVMLSHFTDLPAPEPARFENVVQDISARNVLHSLAPVPRACLGAKANYQAVGRRIDPLLASRGLSLAFLHGPTRSLLVKENLGLSYPTLSEMQMLTVVGGALPEDHVLVSRRSAQLGAGLLSTLHKDRGVILNCKEWNDLVIGRTFAAGECIASFFVQTTAGQNSYRNMVARRDCVLISKVKVGPEVEVVVWFSKMIECGTKMVFSGGGKTTCRVVEDDELPFFSEVEPGVFAPATLQIDEIGWFKRNNPILVSLAAGDEAARGDADASLTTITRTSRDEAHWLLDRTAMAKLGGSQTLNAVGDACEMPAGFPAFTVNYKTPLVGENVEEAEYRKGRACWQTQICSPPAVSRELQEKMARSLAQHSIVNAQVVAKVEHQVYAWLPRMTASDTQPMQE